MKLVVASVIAVLILSLGTVIPLFHPGFFEFHDNTQVVRVQQMGKMLSQNVFPVRWVPDLGYGYGYPIFNFYAPLPYYIGGILNQIGLDVLVSTKVMIGIGVLAASVSMFFLVRRFYGNAPGIVSSVIFAYFPYHAVNIYVRGAVGELFAYAFLPIVFMGVFSLGNTKKLRKLVVPMVLITFGIFLVAVSHNLTLLMLLLLLMPMGVLMFVMSKEKKVFLTSFIGSIAAGLLLSSFYILPAFLEMNYTNVSSQVGGGADFRDHFICLSQYWDSMWGYGGSVSGCMDGLSFKLGKTSILLLVVSVVVILFSLKKFRVTKENKITIISLLGVAITLFMTLSLSAFVWESIPFIGYIQYPWRFINFIALFVSILIGFIIFTIQKNGNVKASWGVAVFIIAITIVVNSKLFLPQYYIDRAHSAYHDREYISFTVSKISDEYLPPGFQKPQSPSELPTDDVQIQKTQGSIDFKKIKDTHYIISYDLQNDGAIHINRAYFPAWSAKIDGQEVEISQVKNGMDISVVGGKGTLELKFENTSLHVISNTITILSFLAISAGIIIVSQRRR